MISKLDGINNQPYPIVLLWFNHKLWTTNYEQWTKSGNPPMAEWTNLCKTNPISRPTPICPPHHTGHGLRATSHDLSKTNPIFPNPEPNVVHGQPTNN